MKDARLLFDRVWKKFHRGQIHDSLRDLIPALAKQLVGRGASDKELSDGDFWAIRDLSFEVRAGQTLGIIGPNGSGKSTTLKLLTRIMQPSRGYCEARGRVGTLIEVSAGFHGDLTGRENVYLQGAIMGMPAADIIRKFDQIVDFAGIAEAIDTPVKRYSSGMNARLGFSIAAHLEPDILIIDEVLAVGDMWFQERAFGRIRELANSGIPVIMVSHQLDRINELCTDCILLDRGEVVTRGTAAEAIAAYVHSHDATRMVESTGLVTFDSLHLEGTGAVRSGDRFFVRIRGHTSVEIEDHIEPMIVRVRSLRTGALVFVSGSRFRGFQLPGAGPFDVCLELQANLPPGSYMIEVAAEDLNLHKDIASATSVMMRVTDTKTFAGHVQLNAGFRLIES
ncbi:MAG: polysaccharide ABC transporter ATP-binding protein [Gemmatimonadaceae bacterium]